MGSDATALQDLPEPKRPSLPMPDSWTTSASMMRRCIRPRAGAAWPLALPFVPYMTANLGRKRAALADASAVVAVTGVSTPATNAINTRHGPIPDRDIPRLLRAPTIFGSTSPPTGGNSGAIGSAAATRRTANVWPDSWGGLP